ncbi:MAG: hypothetical protein CMD43_04515 [Gammaproteobacteria bacterium]|nr:hypothetical protein [Gammaproteobacteria bacterium]|tara:strand:+ start:473 stop:1090 length:618 start_codon:yes stop_codon:yes gene_type:complete
MNNQYSEEEYKLIDWFKSNLFNILTGIFLGFILIFSYKYYNDSIENEQYTLSQRYQAAISKSNEQDTDAILILSNELEKSNPNNIYTAMTNLYASKILVESNNQSDAQQKLNFIIENSDVDEIKIIAKLRLARLYIHQKYFKKAKTLVLSVPQYEDNPLFNEILGDIEYANNNIPSARRYYELSLDGDLVPNKRKIIENKLSSIN